MQAPVPETSFQLKRKREEEDFFCFSFHSNPPDTKKKRFSAVVEQIERFTITIKTLTGRRIAVVLRPSDKIEEIKLQIYQKEGIPFPNQRLVYNGKQLADERTVTEYGLDESTVIHLVLALRGGTVIS
jgi:ubiquitin-like protein Nedd8